MRVSIKICGLTTPEDARAAAQAGADAIGLVFWPRSPRAVTVAAARRIAAALPAFVLRVGVFVNAPREELLRVADEVGLDILQLHGQEPPEALAGLTRRALKAVALAGPEDVQRARRYADSGAALLVDAAGQPAPGGTGRTADWALARRLREQVPELVLAGGLTPENVAAAIAAVEPHGVDVSSGVELAPGCKQAARMQAFVAAVRGVAA